MRKVIISNLAWIEKKTMKEADIFLLKKELRIFPTRMSEEGEQEIPMFRESANYLGLPRHFFRKKFDPSSFEITYDLCQGRRIPQNSKVLTPLKDQAEVIEDMILALTPGNYGLGLLEAFTGFGKSITAVKICESLGVNTIILCHTEAVRDVWVETIEKHYPNATLGIIQGDRCEYKADFVIAMCQSLMFDEGKYPPELYRTFGCLFVDEVHRFGSRSFGSVALKFNARYMFGLSGTIRRKDGCEAVFHYVLGDIITKATEERRVTPIIWLRNSGFVPKITYEIKEDGMGLKRRMKTFDMTESKWKLPHLLGWISDDAKRLGVIADDILKSLKAKPMRNPLVVAERKDPLIELEKIIREKAKKDPFFPPGFPTQGFYMGGEQNKKIKKATHDAAKKKQIIFATLQIAKEGVDIPRLDTLFMMTPVTDCEQLVGRICRPTMEVKANGELGVADRIKPFVFDYVDGKLPLFRGMFWTRYKQYRTLGWPVNGAEQLDLGDTDE